MIYNKIRDSKYTKSFVSNDIDLFKYNKIKDIATDLLMYKNDVSNIVHSNILFYMKMSKFDFITYFTNYYKNEDIKAPFKQELFMAVYTMYRNRQDVILNNVKFKRPKRTIYYNPENNYSTAFLSAVNYIVKMIDENASLEDNLTLLSYKISNFKKPTDVQTLVIHYFNKFGFRLVKQLYNRKLHCINKRNHLIKFSNLTQNIVEKGLKRQKDLLDEKIKWKTLTLVVIAVFVILFIIMIVRHLRASVNKLKVDAIRAKREEQAKTKFFDSINRQIRGPIDTIISLNQKLNMSTGVLVSEEERKSDVRELDNETSYLNDFINDVLNISKIESGTYKINNKPCNIDQLCKSAIESVKATQKIEHVSDCKNASVRTFVCDSILIQWTVSSFLQFALSHTDKVDSIILKSVLSSESLMISVSFVNNQIKATDLETLFDFGKDNGDGNIGLYKSRLIANLLHGIVYARRLENDRLGLFFKLIS